MKYTNKESSLMIRPSKSVNSRVRVRSVVQRKTVIRNKLSAGDKGAIDCCTDKYGRSLGDSNKIKPYYFYGSRVYFSKVILMGHESRKGA